MKSSDTFSIVMIDDECQLCNGFMRWLGGKDDDDSFRFSGIGSNYAKRILSNTKLKNSLSESIILIEGTNVYEASEAVSRIFKKVPGYKWLGSIIQAIPTGIRDRIYFFIARRRMLFFGNSKSCSLDEKLKKKTLH